MFKLVQGVHTLNIVQARPAAQSQVANIKARKSIMTKPKALPRQQSGNQDWGGIRKCSSVEKSGSDLRVVSFAQHHLLISVRKNLFEHSHSTKVQVALQ